MLENAGASNRLYGKSIESLLEQEARLKGFSDEDLASSFTRLVQATHNSRAAFRDLGSAEDIARARHIDVAQAAVVLARAEQGSVESLSRLGIILPHVAGEVDKLKAAHDAAVASGAKFTAAQKFQYQQALATATAYDRNAKRAEALRVVQDRLGGSAAAFGRTAEGGLGRADQSIHQLEVSIGRNLLPPLGQAADEVRTFAIRLSESHDLQEFVRHDLQQIGEALGFVRDVGEAVAPTLLDVAKAGQEIGSVIPVPIILGGVAALKAFGIASGVVGAARTFYVKAVQASVGATVADTAAESGNTAALIANTAALEANIGARAVYTAEAGATIGVNTALAASEAEVAVAGEAAAIGGLGAFTEGVGALALGAVGGPVGLAVVGIGALTAAMIFGQGAAAAYGAQTDQVGDSLRHLADDSKDAVSNARSLADAESRRQTDAIQALRARHQVEQAVGAVAKAKTSGDPTQITNAEDNLREARDQLRLANRQLVRDEQEIAGVRRQTRATTEAENASVRKLVASEQDYADQLRGGIPIADSLAQQTEALRQRAGRFAEQVDHTADSFRKQNPLIAHNLELLATFAHTIGRLPTKREIRIILNNRELRAELANLPGIITAALAVAQAAANAGSATLGQTLRQTIIGDLDPNIGKGIQDKVHDVVKTNLGLSRDKALREARALGRDLGIGVSDGILESDQEQIASLRQTLADTIAEGRKQILESINSAKQNLLSAAQTFESDLQQVQQARGAQPVNPTGPAAAELRRLRAQIAGGDTSEALARRARALTTSIQAQADLRSRSTDKLGHRFEDLADQFDKGAITLQQFNARVNRLLRGAGFNPAEIGRLMGVAFEDKIRAELIGFRQQAEAISRSPKGAPGIAFDIPQVVRPLDTIAQVNKQIRDAQKQIGEAQRKLGHDQLEEQKKGNKALAEINAKLKASAFIAEIQDGTVTLTEKTPRPKGRASRNARDAATAGANAP